MPESGLPIRVYKEHDVWHVDYGEGETEDHTSREEAEAAADAVAQAEARTVLSGGWLERGRRGRYSSTTSCQLSGGLVGVEPRDQRYPRATAQTPPLAGRRCRPVGV
jgi:hypothetical protein